MLLPYREITRLLWTASPEEEAESMLLQLKGVLDRILADEGDLKGIHITGRYAPFLSNQPIHALH